MTETPCQGYLCTSMSSSQARISSPLLIMRQQQRANAVGKGYFGKVSVGLKRVVAKDVAI